MGEFAVGFIGVAVQEVCLEPGYLDIAVYRKMPVPKQGDTDAATQAIIRDPSKAATYDDGKPPLACLPPAGLRAVAQVQAYGHRKYGDFNNYRKGMEGSRNASCAMRHILAWMDGEDLDPESGESHLAHGAARLLFMLQNISDKTMIDDRYKRPTSS